MKNTKSEQMRCFERKKNFIIGETQGDIRIDGLGVDILVKQNTVAFSWDNVSDPMPVYRNHMLCDEENYSIETGDELKVLDYRFALLDDQVLIMGNRLTGITSTLLEMPAGEKVWEGFPRYKRSPRIMKRISEHTITLSKPKPMPEQKKGGLVGLIVPSIAMMCITVMISILMKRGLFILMSVTGTGITMIVSVVKYVMDKKEYKEENARRLNTYQNYLLKKRKEIYQAYKKEEEAYRYNYPDVEEIQQMIHNYSERIYERNANDEDFLSISVGKAYAPCMFQIKMPPEDINSKPDELVEEARSIISQFTNIKQPVVVDLKKAHMGLVGEKDVIHEQLKLILAQITFLHSYRDLEIITIYHEKYDEDFQWLKWYPHLRIHSINAIGTINSERKRDQILGSLHQILKDRKQRLEESKKESMYLPHFLFVIDEPKLIMDHSIMEYLDKEGYNIGLSIIYTTSIRANLPENVGTIVMLENSTQANLLLEEKKERNLDFHLASTKGVNLPWMARDLSVLEHMQGISAQIPNSITFFQMYHVEHPDQLKIPMRWQKNNSSKSLAVPLGVRADEDYVTLNLHEKAHGPHGLVAGTTGSGKSEIVQSYILSLAVNFHPYEVGFLLIDYKGGGMAGLFKNLPHLLGTITNLDGAESRRAMASIKSELARRQRIFNSYDVNHINSYNKLFKNGGAKEPMPHLFIISDEFAELKKEQPEFMTELVTAARIGRSLGVHLILATQKPTGVVDDQIWTNSKFKLALMVQNEADSKEILKTPDAANITNPGRAYLQVGNNEIYELFQSAFSGALYYADKEEEKVDDRVYLINNLGQGELINEDLSDDKEKQKLAMTQLDATTDYIYEIYEQMDTLEVKRPWLPPLKEQILTTQELLDANGKLVDLEVSLGLIDIPEEQKQKEYRINFVTDGNLIYIASSGYGKTFFLITTILTLAMKNSVECLNFYILDFGNSGLIGLNKLHHTADYITLDDNERLQKFQVILHKEIQQRKKLLAEEMVQNFEVYNQVAKKPMKAIVIVLDHFDAVKELGYIGEEFFMKLSRDGFGLGIYFITTVTRSSGLKYSTFNNFKNKIVGFLYDQNDVNTIVGRSVYRPSEIKGRTLIKLNSGVSVMQVYTMIKFPGEIELNKGIEQLIYDINAYYQNDRAPRIPVWPERFVYDQMKDYPVRSEAPFYLGLEKENVDLLGVERFMTPFTILGEASRGKTNALKIILDQLAGKSEIYLFDAPGMELYGFKDRQGLCYIENAEELDSFIKVLEQVVETRKEKIRKHLEKDPSINPKELAMEQSPLYLIVDDWDYFVEFTSKKTSQLYPLISASASVGISVILTANSARLKLFDDMTKYAKNTMDGLLVGSAGTTGIFAVSTAKDVPQFKEGLLFHSGIYQRLRLPKFDSYHTEIVESG